MAVKDLVKKSARGQVYYQLDYDVIVLFGLTELEAYLCWMTRVISESLHLLFADMMLFPGGRTKASQRGSDLTYRLTHAIESQQKFRLRTMPGT